MGTNFYLRCKCCGRQVHIAKRSMGWKPSFEAWPHSDPWYNGHAGYEDEDATRPVIMSVADIKAAYDSGSWDIVSEYGDVLNWNMFEKDVVEWKGGASGRCRSHLKPNDDPDYETYLVLPDKDGNEFCYYEFH
mgnify:CR=1 FL=1